MVETNSVHDVSDVIAHPGIIKVNTTRSAHIFIAEMLRSALVQEKLLSSILQFRGFAIVLNHYIRSRRTKITAYLLYIRMQYVENNCRKRRKMNNRKGITSVIIKRELSQSRVSCL